MGRYLKAERERENKRLRRQKCKKLKKSALVVIYARANFLQGVAVVVKWLACLP